MTVLDKYFELSDIAGNDQAAFRSLIDCFSQDATVWSARGDAIHGKREIEMFYREFFLKSQDLRHLWNTHSDNGTLRAEWAVVGRRPDGSLFSFLGEDIAELDEQQKIRKLEIVFRP